MDTNHGQESLFRDWLNDLIDTHPAYTLRELASFLLVPESTAGAWRMGRATPPRARQREVLRAAAKVGWEVPLEVWLAAGGDSDACPARKPPEEKPAPEEKPPPGEGDSSIVDAPAGRPADWYEPYLQEALVMWFKQDGLATTYLREALSRRDDEIERLRDELGYFRETAARLQADLDNSAEELACLRGSAAGSAAGSAEHAQAVQDSEAALRVQVEKLQAEKSQGWGARAVAVHEREDALRRLRDLEKTHQAVAERLEEYAWAARMAVSWLHLAATKPGEVRAQMPTAEEAGPPA